ncbi:MAG: hypothetical protein LBS99_02230 [Clostridiales bacterium]|jgi:hypothetical protein|nr:hypothetical protein [Clostridiales bacterium]
MKTVKEFVFPVAVTDCGGAVKGTERLKERTVLQIGLSESYCAELPVGAFIVLDFGRELSGGVRILNYHGGGMARLRLGESLAEVNSALNENYSGNDHSTRDAEVYISSYSDMEFFQSGFRFVRLDLLSGETLKIKSITAAYTHADIARGGNFLCSDPLVNTIFETAARTLELNIQNNMLWDGVKRDRLVWAGDLYPEILAATGLYEDTEFADNSIAFLDASTPNGEFMNGMPAYSMWWIILLWEYYLHKGDKSLLVKYAPRVLAEVRLFAEKSRGNILFLDWATHDKADEASGVAAIEFRALQCARRILTEVGLTREALALPQFSGGLLSDGAAFGGAQSAVSRQAAALRLLFGLPQDARVVTAGGAKGMSVFMGYFILKALDRAGGDGGVSAFNVMREYYGGMLKLGATSFWEDFDIEWLKNACPIDRYPKAGEVEPHRVYGEHCYRGFRHSLCHGWAAGVIPYIQQAVMGIEVLSPGCKSISFNPRVNLLKRARATFPTPLGIIAAEFENGKSDVNVPKGVRVESVKT